MIDLHRREDLGPGRGVDPFLGLGICAIVVSLVCLAAIGFGALLSLREFCDPRAGQELPRCVDHAPAMAAFAALGAIGLASMVIYLRRRSRQIQDRRASRRELIVAFVVIGLALAGWATERWATEPRIPSLVGLSVRDSETWPVLSRLMVVQIVSMKDCSSEEEAVVIEQDRPAGGRIAGSPVISVRAGCAKRVRPLPTAEPAPILS
ncbi:MAG: hypothetical protein WDA27_13635 [Actinomycetota bacterium]